jgi:hypothetical protein
MKDQIGRYRRPSQSGYARGSWWTGHAAELIGAAAGFALGMLLWLLARLASPGIDLAWLPIVLLLVGAIATRALVLRQFRR